MNNSTKVKILSYASQPDKNYNFYGDEVIYDNKRYFVNLSEEKVIFLGIVERSELK